MNNIGKGVVRDRTVRVDLVGVLIDLFLRDTLLEDDDVV